VSFERVWFAAPDVPEQDAVSVLGVLDDPLGGLIHVHDAVDGGHIVRSTHEGEGVANYARWLVFGVVPALQVALDGFREAPGSSAEDSHGDWLTHFVN
jgi:hypothetical protein